MVKYFKTITNVEKNSDIEILPVEFPHPFEYKGINLFSHTENGKWKVTEITSGLLLIGGGKTEEEIIKKAKLRIDQLGETEVKGHIERGYERNKTEIDKYLGVVTIKRMVIQ